MRTPKLILTLSCLFGSLIFVQGQVKKETIPLDMIVKDWAEYLPDYDARYHTMITETEVLPETARTSERARVTNEIKDDFIKTRTAEFESKSKNLSVSHVCKKSYSGGKKVKCGWKYVVSPHSNIHTRNDLISVAGKSKRTGLFENGSKAGIYLSKSGKGTDRGTLTATFVYRPEFIKETVNRDMGDLWRAIVAKN